MKRKLARRLDGHAVCVVHPIAVEKRIVKVDEAGKAISRRRSPRRGAAVDLFGELVSFPQLVLPFHGHEGLGLGAFVVGLVAGSQSTAC